MPPEAPKDDLSSLARARERLYDPNARFEEAHDSLKHAGEHGTPHTWGDEHVLAETHARGKRHVRLAGIFFGFAVLFFVAAAGVAGYLFYYGTNTVSVNNVDIGIQGPTTIAAGDTVPLSLTITNRNPAAIDNATIEVDFPDSTRSADNLATPYPRYTENLGTIPSGQTVTRSVKAVVFGGAGQSITLPVSLSYETTGSNAVFVKKSTYALSISSTPLSVSVDTLAETVSGKPLTLTLTVRSNATVPLQNVVVEGAFPFGFQPTDSSVPMSGSSFLLGTMQPGDTKTITLTGSLTGQDSEQRVFHFTVGTANAAGETTPAIAYMTQDATVSIAAPFIATSLSINGVSAANPVVVPGQMQNVSLSYTNTLTTSVTNATVSVQVSGTSVDYGSIRTTSGFYQSSDHTIVFSRDTDPSLANLAPGASGIGSFTFNTLPPSGTVESPQVVFTISVSGTRVGQANVPEQVSASQTESVKVATQVALVAQSLHASGPFPNTGPIPPHANTPTTYTIQWNAQDEGSAVAGGTVTAILPTYVTYTGQTTGSGSITYDAASRMVTWNAGDLNQGGSAQAAFQVSFTPSTSQQGSAPVLAGQSAFTGYDRYAGVQVTSNAAPVTTETAGDPGYVPTDATVQ